MEKQAFYHPNKNKLMKPAFLSLILTGAILLYGFSSIAKEWIPDYHVASSNFDKNLKSTEAIFDFTFFNPERKGIKGEIKMSYNGKELTIKTDEKGKGSLKVKPGTYVLKFLFNARHFEVTTDSILIKPGYRSEIQISFRSSNAPIIVEKPVIYIYSPFKNEIKISLHPKGKIDFSYPEYKSGWKITADTNGTILSEGKQYHYLFWEGKIDFDETKINMNEGFIVGKNNLIEFFEKKLSQMGLNSKEIEDYITYWCPRMDSCQKTFIRFMFNEEYNKYASLTIEPKPDKVFRVFMLWKGLEDGVTTKVKEQTLSSFTRSGFTVVEWGGGQITEADQKSLHSLTKTQ
jgi:hypothetical protein